jgi:hypothetical protein
MIAKGGGKAVKISDQFYPNARSGARPQRAVRQIRKIRD